MTATLPLPKPVAVQLDSSATDYRTLMRCHESAPWLDRVVEQASDWLRVRKRWDVPVDKDGLYTDGNRRLHVRRHEVAGESALRIQLTEQQPQVEWSTRLLAVESPRSGWISLDVTNDRGLFADVPNPAKYLVGVLPLRDGDVEYTDDVRIVREHELDRLLDELNDETRRSPMFVAGSNDDIPFDAWTDQLRKWFRQLYGVGHAVSLTPEATRVFADRMPRDGATSPWTIRTYLRGLSDDSGESLRRHKILSTKRLAEMSDGAVAKLLGRVAREQTARRAARDDVVAWERRFTRLANRDIVSLEAAAAKASSIVVEAEAHAIAIPPAELTPPARTHVLPPKPAVPMPLPTKAPQPSSDGPAVVSSILAIFGLTEFDEAGLRHIAEDAATADVLRAKVKEIGEHLDAQTTRAESFTDEIGELHTDIDDLFLEGRDLEEQLQAQDDEIRRLRSRLASQERAEEAFDESIGADPTELVSSYSELLDKITGLEDQGVLFSGDTETTLELDRHDEIGKCVLNAWRACLALADYVKAKREGVVTQGVRWYLENCPQGYRTFPVRSHARNETAETMRRFGDERVFTVPKSVDLSGRKLMVEHFKLGRLARKDPRLYYYDDTLDTGCVYIGYLGVHLTNTHT